MGFAEVDVESRLLRLIPEWLQKSTAREHGQTGDRQVGDRGTVLRPSTFSRGTSFRHLLRSCIGNGCVQITM